MDILADANLVGLDPTAKTRSGDAIRDYFHVHRHWSYTTTREPLDVEEKAWRALMASACRQNGFNSSEYEIDNDNTSGQDSTDSVSAAEYVDSDDDQFVDALDSYDDEQHRAD